MSQISSFRDAAKTRRANASAKSETTEHLKESNTLMEDVVAASELNAEVAEKNLSELKSINKKSDNLQDQVAGTELVAENTETANEHLSSVAANTKSIYSKLSEFAAKLKDNFQTDTETTQINPGSTSSQIINIINESDETPQDSVETLLRRIADDIEYIKDEEKFKPETPPTDTPTEDTPDTNKPEKDEELYARLDRLTSQIVKAVDTGFNRTLRVADSISSMLFKYTVSALLNTAKLMAIILAAVIALDLLIIHFRYWSKMFDTNLKEFNERLGNLAPIFEQIFGATSDMVNYWKKGEYSKVFARLGKAIGDTAMTAAEYLLLGLGKLMAVVLRATGADETADSLETAAINRASEKIGYMADDEELDMIANTKQRQGEENNKARISPSGGILGMNTNDEAAREAVRKAEAGEVNLYKQKNSKEQQREAVKAQQNLNRLKLSDSVNETDTGRVDQVLLEIDKLQKDVKQKEEAGLIHKADSTPLLRELQSFQQSLEEKSESLKIEASPPLAEDTQKQQTITAEMQKEEQKPVQQASNINTNTQVVNTNSSTYVQAPRTSSPAPGLPTVI